VVWLLRVAPDPQQFIREGDDVQVRCASSTKTLKGKVVSVQLRSDTPLTIKTTRGRTFTVGPKDTVRKTGSVTDDGSADVVWNYDPMVGLKPLTSFAVVGKSDVSDLVMKIPAKDTATAAWPISVVFRNGATDRAKRKFEKLDEAVRPYAEINALMKFLGGFRYNASTGTTQPDGEIPELTQSRAHLRDKNFHIVVEVISSNTKSVIPVYELRYDDRRSDVSAKIDKATGMTESIVHYDWLQGPRHGIEEETFGEYCEKNEVDMQKTLLCVSASEV